MMRLGMFCASLGAVLFLGCSLDFNECGQNGLNCGGTESMCICSTGKCAEPDEDCPSGLHYVGGRCVPADEASSGVRSTPDRPGTCVTDGPRDTRD